MAKPKLPEPKFYTLPTLAHAWGCDVEQIELYAMFEGLQLRSVPMTDGREIPIVAHAERLRFEGQARPEPRYNSTERETHRLLIGALAAAYCGNEPEMIAEPGRLVTDLMACADANHIPIPRGYDTNRAAIAEGIEALRAYGYKPPKPKPKAPVIPLVQSEKPSELRTA